jgi:hypothetical protein
LRVDDLEQRRLAQHLDRLLRVVDARQLDDDLVVAAGLDQRLADAEAVDAPLEGPPRPLQRFLVDLLAGDRARLHHDLEPALEVEPLPGRVPRLEPADVEHRPRQRDPAGEERQQHDPDQHMPGANPHAEHLGPPTRRPPAPTIGRPARRPSGR